VYNYISKCTKLPGKYLPRNLCGLGKRLGTVNFQPAFYVSLNHRVVVVQLYLSNKLTRVISSENDTTEIYTQNKHSVLGKNNPSVFSHCLTSN